MVQSSMPTTSTLAGAVLAGGESRRMGRPKEGVRLADGRPMIEHVLDALRPHCGSIIILGEARGYPAEKHPELTYLADETPGQGPLGGVETLLASGRADRYLLVTCDQPLLTPPLLAPLVASAGERPTFLRTESGDPLDPFPCLLPTPWLDSVRGALSRNERSIRALIRNSVVDWLTVHDSLAVQTESFNDPAALDRHGLSAAQGGIEK